MYRCLQGFTTSISMNIIYDSNFLGKKFKSILRMLEAEIAQNLRMPSFNLENVVLIKKTYMAVFDDKNSLIDIIINDKMCDDEGVASDVLPALLVFCCLLLFFYYIDSSTCKILELMNLEYVLWLSGR